MTNLLVLGGTTEGTRLGRALAEAGVNGTISMAGRVASPAAQALPLRVGGFGAAEGLARLARRFPGAVRVVRPEGVLLNEDAWVEVNGQKMQQ